MRPYDAYGRVESFLFGVYSCFTVSFFLGVVYNILFIAVMKVVNWPAIDGAVSS
ncbi:uncharacterized protein J3R85_006217 [Psidium guajava]|nr:uncharacterized protein J3R85_006217 [Psidium guajava]